MSINIRREGGQYAAVVSPPHGREPWSTPEPMSAVQLVDALRGLGCHTTDISDAFYDADPEWLDQVRDE